jgi:betaine-aldehyde dehydrogenase
MDRTARDGLLARELWGKNPQVSFSSADTQRLTLWYWGVDFIVAQSRNSDCRMIVHEYIAEALATRVITLSRQVARGEPPNPATRTGAIVAPELGAGINTRVAATRAAVAKVDAGGDLLQVHGPPCRTSLRRNSCGI